MIRRHLEFTCAEARLVGTMDTPTEGVCGRTGLLLVSGWWDLLVADIRGWFFPDFTTSV